MHRATPSTTSFRAYVGGGGRASVMSVDDTQLMQEHNSSFMASEARQAIESPQNYGFTSVAAPPTMDEFGNVTACAECAISFMGGNRSFPVAGNMDDRRHRLYKLAQGDTAMFRQKDDKQQFHMTTDGGFWSAPQDKTVRMALLDESSGSQQSQGQGGQSGGNGSSGGGQQWGQTSLQSANQQAGKFFDITQSATRAAGKIVQLIMAAATGGGSRDSSSSGSDSGTVLAEMSGGNCYVGGTPQKNKFALVVTVAGPTINVPGRIA